MGQHKRNLLGVQTRVLVRYIAGHFAFASGPPCYQLVKVRFHSASFEASDLDSQIRSGG
jgi:hypothetical protein